MRWTAAKYCDYFDRKQNIGFFTTLAAEAGRVLDIGAGTGRISIAMAEAGAKVTAVEPDPNFRAMFKQNIDTYPKDVQKNIEMMRGDMLNFSTARRFPLIILAGVFESLYSKDQRFSALQRFHEMLEPGGRLVFDLLSVNIGDFPLKEVDRITEGNEQYIRKMACKIDKTEKVARIRFIYETHVSGNFFDEVEEIRVVALVEPREVSEGLIEAGFRDFQFYGGYDRRPYDLYARTLVVEAWEKGA